MEIDLHGYSLEEANKKIFSFINDCYEKNIKSINVITGKGLRSKNIEDPYSSSDLGMLKSSVPDFIKSDTELNDLIIDADKLDLLEDLDDIEYIVDVEDDKLRYSIKEQVDDLLDDLEEPPKLDLSSLTKEELLDKKNDELRNYLKSLDLSTNGNKNQLVENILDKNIPELPTQVELKLPKLQLPKLQKIK